MGPLEVLGAPRGGGPSSVPSLDLPRTLSAPALRDEAKAALHADAAAASWMRLTLLVEEGELHTHCETFAARGPIHSCPNSFRATYLPDASSSQFAAGHPTGAVVSTARGGPLLPSLRASCSSRHTEELTLEHQHQPQPQPHRAAVPFVAQSRRSSSATSPLRRAQGSARGAAPRSASARHLVEEAPRSFFEEMALAAGAAAACSPRDGGGSRGRLPCSPRGPAGADSAPLLMQSTSPSPSSSSARLQLRTVRAESISSFSVLKEHRLSPHVSLSAPYHPRFLDHSCSKQPSPIHPQRSSSTPPRSACFVAHASAHASRAPTSEGDSAPRSFSAPVNSARGPPPSADASGAPLQTASTEERKEAAAAAAASAGWDGGERVEPYLDQSEPLSRDRFDGLLPELKPRLSQTWTDEACYSDAGWCGFDPTQQGAAAAAPHVWESDNDTASPRQSAGTEPLQLDHLLGRSLRSQRDAWGAPPRREASSFSVNTDRGALAEAFLHASIEEQQQADSVKEGRPQGPVQGPAFDLGKPPLARGLSATVGQQQRGGPRALEMEGFVKGVQSCISRLIKSFPAGFELHNGYGGLQVPEYWVTERETAAAHLRGVHAHDASARSSEGGEAQGLLRFPENHPHSSPNQEQQPPAVFTADGGSSERSFSRFSDAAGMGGPPLTAEGPEVFFAIGGATPEESACAASCYYSIEALVGRGAHGAVFRAKRLVKAARAASPQSNPKKKGSEEATEADGAACAHEVEVEEDEVALKILDLDGALRTQCMDASGRAQYMQRVVTEANVLSQLEHENIVKFYEAFQWPPCYLVLVTEYLPGGSLRDLCKSSGPLPEAVIARVLKDVTLALDYLHDEHVQADGSLKARCMHRDVKAANILLTESGRAKLIDFGVSTMFVETDTEFAGTPQWMAPEVAQILCLHHKLANNVDTADTPPQFVPYNCSVDIWSLGITAYELAMGCLPWPHGTKLDQLMHMIAYGPAPRINLNEGFERSFCYFVEKCLRKKANERGQASELLRHEFFTKFCSGKRPQSYHELREAVETFNGKRQASMLTAVARYLTFWNRKGSGAAACGSSVSKRRLPLEKLATWGGCESVGRTGAQGEAKKNGQDKSVPPHSSSSHLVVLSGDSNEDKGGSRSQSKRPEAVPAVKLLALPGADGAHTGSQEGAWLDSIPPAENGDQQSDWATPSAQRPPASLAPKEWPVSSPKCAARLQRDLHEPPLSRERRDSDESSSVARLPVDSSLSSSSTADIGAAHGGASKGAQEGAPPGGAPSAGSSAPSEPPQPSQSFFSFFLSAFQGSSVKRESTSTTDVAVTPIETHADSGKNQQAADTAAPRGKRGSLDKCANVALHGAGPPVGSLHQGPLAQIAGLGPPPPRRFRKTRIAGIRRRSRHRDTKSSLQRGADRFLGFFRRGGGPTAQDRPSSEDSKDAQSCSSEAGSERGMEVDRGERSSSAGSYTEERPPLQEQRSHHEGRGVGGGPPVGCSSSRDQAAPKKQPLLSAHFRQMLESPTLATAVPHPEAPHATEGVLECASTVSPFVMRAINEQQLASEDRLSPLEPSVSHFSDFSLEQACSTEAAAAGEESREGAVLCKEEEEIVRLPCSSLSTDGDSRGVTGSPHQSQSVGQPAAETGAFISQSESGPPGTAEEERGWLSGPNLYKRLLDGIVQFVDSSAVRRPPTDREALSAVPPPSGSGKTNPSLVGAPAAASAAAAHAPGIELLRDSPLLLGGSNGPLVDQPAARESRTPSWLWNLIYRQQQSSPSSEARIPSFIAASYLADDNNQQPEHFRRPQWIQGTDENAADLYAPVGQTPTAPSRSGLISPLHEYHTVEAEETPAAAAAFAALAAAGPSYTDRIEKVQVGAISHEGVMPDGNLREQVPTCRKSIPIISTTEKIRFTTLAEDLERQRQQHLQSVPHEYRAAGLERGVCFLSAQQAPPFTDPALLHALRVFQREDMVQQPVSINTVPVQYVLPTRYPPEYMPVASQGGLPTFVHNNAVPVPAGWEECHQVVGFPVRWGVGGAPPRGPPPQPIARALCDTQEFVLLPAAHHHPAQP
ncbi:hypothetical protein Esti_005004 [Eimeria stiedai]